MFFLSFILMSLACLFAQFGEWGAATAGGGLSVFYALFEIADRIDTARRAIIKEMEDLRNR